MLALREGCGYHFVLLYIALKLPPGQAIPSTILSYCRHSVCRVRQKKTAPVESPSQPWDYVWQLSSAQSHPSPSSDDDRRRNHQP
ncbi:hypothetical protein BDV59DRAFT_181255 [Aspergillus ambiguus]|uniref:uncharacterized protein n=1 Tax=Aspergillus ambiguus TaxID=176160 RepID=UPI003CCD3EE6